VLQAFIEEFSMKKTVVKEEKSSPVHFKTSKIKQTFFWCLLVIIPLVLIELFSYSYIKLVIGKKPYRGKLEKIRHVKNPYHPYLGYVHAPNLNIRISKPLSKEKKLVTDDNGFSVTPSFSFANQDLTIAVTGGSTIFGVGSTDNSTTVPSILERLINQRMNIRAEVANLALRGGQSFQEMLLVDRFFAENQADLVLAISGRNDADAYFHDPTVEGAFLKKDIWNNAVSLVHRAERSEFVVIGLQSKLRSLSYTYDLLYRFLGPSKNSPPPPPAAAPDPNLRREAVINMKQRAKITATHFAAADQISRMNGASFVMFLQPTLFGKNIWSEAEIRRTARIRKKVGDDRFNKDRQNETEFYDAFQKSKKPFHFIDLSGIFLESEETLYIDVCHYNDLAAEKFAEKIFESIQPLLLKMSTR
jgi:hypothetical protein